MCKEADTESIGSDERWHYRDLDLKILDAQWRIRLMYKILIGKELDYEPEGKD